MSFFHNFNKNRKILLKYSNKYANESLNCYIGSISSTATILLPSWRKKKYEKKMDARITCVTAVPLEIMDREQ